MDQERRDVGRCDAGNSLGFAKSFRVVAMKLLERDGILISCSCSYHMSLESLIDAVQRAARHLNRFVQIIEIGGQSADHPIHPAIVETRYLKAIVVRVVGE